MQALSAALLDDPIIRSVVYAPDAGRCPAVLSGLSQIHRAHLLAAVRGELMRPVVMLVSDEMEAKRALGDIATLTGTEPISLPTRDFLFRDMEGASRELEQQRLRALYSISRDDAENPFVLITTAPALMQRTAPPDVLTKAIRTISPGDTCDLDALCDLLTSAGYSRAEQVEGRGQYARRGGILDFFSPAHENPVRAEFFGDEIDSLSFFDTATQRRGDMCDTALILPAAETLPGLAPGGIDGLIAALETLRDRPTHHHAKTSPASGAHDVIARDIDRLRGGRSFPAIDKYMELCYDMATALDYLPPDTIVILSEPNRVREVSERYEKQLAEECVPLLESGALDSSLVRFSLSSEEFFAEMNSFAVIMADVFTTSRYPLEPRMLESVLTKQLPSYGGSLETALGDLAHYGQTDFRTVITVPTEKRAEALAEYLSEHGVLAALDFSLAKLPEPGCCSIAVGSLSNGMEYPGIKLAVITEGQLTDHSPQKLRRVKKTNRERVQSFTDLSPGDLVVHEHYGIGRFVGLSRETHDGVTKDYIKISYRDGDSLYIPATQLDLVSKYIGTSGEDSSAPVRLSKMGGADWTRAKSRARASAKDMARELIALYAARARVRGHAFAPDSVWQTEFEEKFGYVETDDQLRCIDEIKRDMERVSPMDRLLCGDVGYGKTEVAMRAVMKCVLDGFQAAILVPTTVLARQHYITAVKRFAGYPVNIEVLSRFVSPAEIKRTLKKLEQGSVDLVIGTHRLLQKDVKFGKLGLLVVDEEQRFGVTHKERLKEISQAVDVLTLSATPIPRTLNMALSGIRDMSVLEEPPTGRQPVSTYVMEHDWAMLADAMSREVARGGQIYYLHNRIDNIERTAAQISQLLNGDLPQSDPRAIAIGVAHGRLDEDALSDVMERFSDGEISILVCTTIIETGLDIPNVNTLIIEDADHMGLAQLHQIRGRVGRSPRRAFAYLTFRRGKVLTEVAEKRLGAIREFAEFNSGFKIAMRDLEIRGAGNLLGAEQSGHMMKVGYDMYLKLLEEAVLEERGEKQRTMSECSADLAVSALLPESYVPSAEQRIDLYRRIARVSTEEHADEMIAELIDRFGDPPPEAVNLVRIAKLRSDAAQCDISDISQKSGKLSLKLAEFDMRIISELYARPEFTGRLQVEAGSSPVVSLKLKSGLGVLDDAERLVTCWRKSMAA